MKHPIEFSFRKIGKNFVPFLLIPANDILKREMYYGHKFTSREQLIQAILDYIYFYNYQRLQRRLSVMSPMEFHEQYAKAA